MNFEGREMKGDRATEEDWLNAVTAAQNRDWDVPADPRHNPEAALAAIKRAHQQPVSKAQPNEEQMFESADLFLPTTVSMPKIGYPIRFRLRWIRTGVPRSILPAEEHLAYLELSYRRDYIRLWLAQIKIPAARERQARAKDKASQKRSDIGHFEAKKTVAAFENSGLPLHSRAAWLAKKFGVTPACIRQRLKRAGARKTKLTNFEDI